MSPHLAPLAAAGQTGVKYHPAPVATYAREGEKMEPINLEPRFSTMEIPGKCIKCLAEQELNNCLTELLKGKGENKELEQRFEALVAFLKSPESEKLRAESERYLAQGKGVRVRIYFEEGKPRYEIEIS